MNAIDLGEALLATRNVRHSLQWMRESGLYHSLLDVGCGNFGWFSALDPEGLDYTGIDKNTDLINENRMRWERNGCRFLEWDITQAVPPRADLALCRDVLSGFSPSQAAKALNHLKQSGTRYLAVTGYVRELARLDKEPSIANLQSAPFSFPPPLYSIPENEPGKMLDIWQLSSLPELFSADVEGQTQFSLTTADDFARLPFFQSLCGLPFVKAVHLFGSRARGDYRPDSDIDLLVTCDESASLRDWERVCDITGHARLPVGMDCLRNGDPLESAMPGLKQGRLMCLVTLYERTQETQSQDDFVKRSLKPK